MSIKSRWKKNSWWESFFVILFATIGLSLVVFGSSILSDYSKTYVGKALFATEKSYGEFKKELADPNVKVQSIKVLSSEPSLVFFTVEVPKVSDFPFGSLLTPTINGPGVFYISLGVFLLGGSVFVFFGDG